MVLICTFKQIKHRVGLSTIFQISESCAGFQQGRSHSVGHLIQKYATRTFKQQFQHFQVELRSLTVLEHQQISFVTTQNTVIL